MIRQVARNTEQECRQSLRFPNAAVAERAQSLEEHILKKVARNIGISGFRKKYRENSVAVHLYKLLLGLAVPTLNSDGESSLLFRVRKNFGHPNDPCI